MAKKIQTITYTSSDNTYLHKDFHGALCYAIKYLDETFGPNKTKKYLQQVAKTYFAPLTEALQRDGLSVLKKHFEHIFTLEGGEFDFKDADNTLVLEVKKCPAILHLIEKGQLFTERYCESTVVVNETVCEAAGYQCSCQYEPGQGACVQKFWKADKETQK